MKRDDRDWYEFALWTTKKSCAAVCADTGKRCQLPQHSEKAPHANGRYRFYVTAAPGQTRFRLAELRDELATAQGIDVTTLIRGVAA